MNSKEYFLWCLDHYVVIGANGERRVKIQQATRDWANHYPNESCALVKRRNSLANEKWCHLLMPEFYVETYTKNRYEDADWFAVIGNYEEVREEQLHTIEANIHG